MHTVKADADADGWNVLLATRAGKDTSPMMIDGLRASLKAPKLVLRFRSMAQSCIISLQSGVCAVLTNEDMPLLFLRIVSCVARAGATASCIDDGV